MFKRLLRIIQNKGKVEMCFKMISLSFAYKLKGSCYHFWNQGLTGSPLFFCERISTIPWQIIEYSLAITQLLNKHLIFDHLLSTTAWSLCNTSLLSCCQGQSLWRPAKQSSPIGLFWLYSHKGSLGYRSGGYFGG